MLLAYARFLEFHYSRAGCGGEAVRRLAAFPPRIPHPAILKRLVKGYK